MVELVYVDEVEAQANQVVRSAVSSGYFDKDQVVPLQPEPTLEATIELILEHNCSALIADYQLSEHMAMVEFNGAELVQEYQRRFDRFPCFVATAYAEEAIEETIDANIVFPKSDFLRSDPGSAVSSDSELPFFLRVRKKIDEYLSYVETAVKEFNRLSELGDQGELNAQQVERLIELDGVVEALRGKSLAVPKHLKGDRLAAFTDLVGRAEELAERVRRELAQPQGSDLSENLKREFEEGS